MSEPLTMDEREQAVLALDSAIGVLATARALIARQAPGKPAAAAVPDGCQHPLNRRHRVEAFGPDGPVFCNACGEQLPDD